MDPGRSWTVLIILGYLHFSASDYAAYKKFLDDQSQNATFVAMFEEHLKQYEEDYKTDKLKASATFQCPALPEAEEPTSVHKLGPTDIKVVAAMGDSITAGTGILANTVLGLLIQYRGKSWSVGGEKTIDTYETVPNMLKMYTDNSVKGYSTGNGGVYSHQAHLNVAHPGDTSQDMPGQAVELVRRMKEDSSIDFEKDWKLITLFVGGNDLCDYCNDKSRYSAENYRNHIREALDILHREIPRAFVNLVEVLDVSIVKTLNLNLVCSGLHLYLCDCAAFPRSSEAEQELQTETERYRQLVEEMVESGRYDTRDDFTVVIQPFWKDTSPPFLANNKPDASYFAPDCFHLSLKGHAAAADALWNNMITPVGQKQTSWRPGEKVMCPTNDQPYFYTYKNSQQTSQVNSALGAYNAQDDPAENSKRVPNDSPDDTPNDSHPFSAAVVGSVGFVCALALVISVIVYKRNKRRKTEESLHLLQTSHRATYEQI